MMRMNSLKSKLSMTILLLAAPMFIVSLGMLFTESRTMIRKEAVGRATSVLNSAKEHMFQYMQTIETATNANSLFIAGCRSADSLFFLTRYIVGINGNIDGCSISMEPYYFPEYGRNYSAYTVRQTREGRPDTLLTVVERPYDYFDKEWYKAPMEKGTACWVEFFDEADTLEVTISGMVVSYCKPIYDAAGNAVAVVSTDVSLKHLAMSVNKEHPYPNSYFIMLGKDGHYFIHPDSTRLFTQTIFSDAKTGVDDGLAQLGTEMTKGGEGSLFLDVEGTPSLVVYQPVPGTDWSLAIVCPDSDILDGYHQLAYILVPLLVLGMMFILLLCYHAVADAMGPLEELLEKTQAVAGGDMEVHIGHSGRQDAVGRLQNSFASMLQSLKFHIGSVRYSTEMAQQRYEELEKATRLAEEAERQKTTFIQNVTHQIRTPLNIIMGFAQILSNKQMTALTDEEMKSITQTMDYNSRLLNRIVLMLFDSSDTGFLQELNSHKADKVTCNSVARDAVGFVAAHFPHVRIHFHTELDDSFSLQTNVLYLARSLRELLFNAAKYSDGNNVSLSVEADDKVRFIVQDTGKGIDRDDHKRMFTLFAKVDDLSEGLGLGLPLVKRHVMNLGGDLFLDAAYHDGCRFVIELPLPTAAAAS